MSARVPDYVAIGHMTLDRTPRGDILGGTVLYAALAARQLGLRVAVFTRANLDALTPAQREELDWVTSQLELIAQDAPATTTFTNREVAGRREQTLHAWGGLIDLTGLPPLWRSARVIHLAPVAQEIDARQVGRLAPQFLGCTPQGWMRGWAPERLGPVRREPLRLPADLVARLDGLVLSWEEYAQARDIVEEVGRNGLAVITRGEQGAILLDRGRRVEVPAYPARRIDPTGAGDVFAGVLFAARALGESVAASARLASAAAALKVGGEGIRAVPTREAVDRLINRSLPVRERS